MQPAGRIEPLAWMTAPAARALLDSTDLDARTVVARSLAIAADICIYTNHNVTIETL